MLPKPLRSLLCWGLCTASSFQLAPSVLHTHTMGFSFCFNLSSNIGRYFPKSVMTIQSGASLQSDSSLYITVFCILQASVSISLIRFHLLSFSIIAQRQHEFKRNKTSLHGAWGDGSVDNNTHSADMRIWVWTPSTHRKSLACMTTHAYGSSTAG